MLKRKKYANRAPGAIPHGRPLPQKLVLFVIMIMVIIITTITTFMITIIFLLFFLLMLLFTPFFTIITTISCYHIAVFPNFAGSNFQPSSFEFRNLFSLEVKTLATDVGPLTLQI